MAKALINVGDVIFYVNKGNNHDIKDGTKLIVEDTCHNMFRASESGEYEPLPGKMIYFNLNEEGILFTRLTKKKKIG